MFLQQLHRGTFLFVLLAVCLLFCSCSQADAAVDASKADSVTKGSRTSTPKVLTPKKSDPVTQEDQYAAIDISNSQNGYFMVKYIGSSDKIKLRVTAPDGVVNDYNIKKSDTFESFPFSQGDGAYEIRICEQLAGEKYAIVSSLTADVKMTDPFGAFLYPNQYVNFTSNSKAVSKAEELAKDASCDLDVITSVYNYVVDTISYDEEKADSVQFDYIPDVDETLDSTKGICFDYASLMGSMLRSQSIPTKIEVGYSGEIYHAWISTYTKEQGWIDDIIEFDGKEWSLMDPTFASSGKNDKKIQKYIGDASNYVVKHIY